MSSTVEARPGPREVFELLRELWLGQSEAVDALWADDVVVETPFAPPGAPSRIVGRAEFLAFAEPTRRALPVRFDECRDVVVHDTTDPEVIVVEYELAGTVTSTGRRASAAFVGVLRVRDGRIVRWREYQNVPAISAALGRLPDLLAAYVAVKRDLERRFPDDRPAYVAGKDAFVAAVLAGER